MKLYLILIYRYADCIKSMYLKTANNQYAFKEYTPMILQLYTLLTSNVLLLNAVLSLDSRLPKDLQGGVLYTILFLKTRIYNPQNNVCYMTPIKDLL